MEVTKTIKISLDDIKGDIGQGEALELLEHVNDYSYDFREKVMDKLGLDDSDLIEFISGSYLEKHFKQNLDYYDSTKELLRKNKELSEEVENLTQQDKFKENFQLAVDSNNKEQAKRYLCDLFNLGYHSNGELAKKIDELIK